MLLTSGKESVGLGIVTQIWNHGSQSFQQLVDGSMGDQWSILGLLEDHGLVIACQASDLAACGREYCLTNLGMQVAQNLTPMPVLKIETRLETVLLTVLLVALTGHFLVFGYVTSLRLQDIAKTRRQIMLAVYELSCSIVL